MSRFLQWSESGRAQAAQARPLDRFSIDSDADQAFAKGVRKVIAISDQVAEAAGPTMRDQMSGAFVRAAQRVWIFWDSAYRLERWPV